MSDNPSSFLSTGSNFREAAHELLQKEQQLREEAKRITAKAKQYKARELQLFSNNKKLEIYLQSLRLSNQSLSDEIAQKTAIKDQNREKLKLHKAQNVKELKEKRELLQRQEAFYGNAMVAAQDEYKLENLRQDTQFLSQNIDITDKNNALVRNAIKTLEEDCEAAPDSQLLDEVDAVIKMLEDEDEVLTRKIRSQENTQAELEREIKQLKLQLSKLQKKHAK